MRANVCVMALVVSVAASASGQVHPTGTANAFAGIASGMTLLQGCNQAASGAMNGNTFTASFTGDVVASLYSGTGAGTYSGSTGVGSLVGFSVGNLPVRIGSGSMDANFKLVASGGNGVDGGNDPNVTVWVLGRLYQQMGNAPNPSADAWLSAIEFSRTYTRNGNGLQIVDDHFGPSTSGYILTPGNYYLYQQIYITTTVTNTGLIQPTRGMAVEFGGQLSAGTYAGFSYSFDWQTVPTPGSMAVLALSGLLARRRGR